jgi:hypothetical protein
MDDSLELITMLHDTHHANGIVCLSNALIGKINRGLAANYVFIATSPVGSSEPVQTRH